MKRRALLAVVAGAVVARPFASRAQQAGKVRRIGFLWDSPSAYGDAIEAFRRGLRDLGWIEGQNITIEYRWADGKPDRMRELAEELVRLEVDILVAPTSIYTEAAKRATSTIPIIFMTHADPIGSGHVASLARPGGNITGLSMMQTETGAKGVELLKDALPELTRVAVVFDPATPSHGPGRQAVAAAGAALRLEIRAVPVGTVSEFDSAFAAISREHAGAVLILATPLYVTGARRLAELAIAHKLPSMSGVRQFVEAGGLLSFGTDRNDLCRRAATYVDKILKGASPADLPVEQPTKFELVVNLKTAKAIGLTIPLAFLLRADEVIE
jgi:putative tryptophan/tyrosine transport system substrate-binding protein